ncbi:MAG: FtsX-like permease family protein [Roseburia sp.]|nr:FtsX-like permease family protein [Roseburia sp.]
MRAGWMFPRLAFTGIRKNKRLYYPYILACMGMVMMFYIFSSLSYCSLFDYIRGGGIAAYTLSLGKWVIGIFSLIFLFYIHSFLLRRRNKEFGLYHILGMDKKNLAKVMAIECLLVSALGLLGGLMLGIAFSKLAEIGFLNAIGAELDYSFRIPVQAVVSTVEVFGVIFCLLFLNALWKIYRSSALELLRSENVGEKPPKANWLIAALGFAVLGSAYYMAISVENPLAALEIFFVAVVMVVLATYMLFVAGSVVICRILQNRKSFYYRKNHFVSVSSMVYRMKRNGAGLASICILSTMVLVMVSATTSLFLGAEESIRTRYPREIIAEFTLDSLEAAYSPKLDKIREAANRVREQEQVSGEGTLDYFYAVTFGMLQGEKLDTNVQYYGGTGSGGTICMVFLLPLEEYNRLAGQECTLGENEAFIFSVRMDYQGKAIQIGDCPRLERKEAVAGIPLGGGEAAMMTFPSLYVVVEDMESYIAPLCGLADYRGEPLLLYRWLYGFDVSGEDERQIRVKEQLVQELAQVFQEDDCGIVRGSYSSVAEERSGFYEIYGGLFFLGIMLSLLFIVATVIIIYYKQVCEGYEDQSRFEIMQKVGMTRQDIRKSINSQVLIVFFSPLLMAGMHLCFAYPLIWKILQMFSIQNLSFVLFVTVIVYLIVALLYMTVYRVTSNAYYAIVSDGRD